MIWRLSVVFLAALPLFAGDDSVRVGVFGLFQPSAATVEALSVVVDGREISLEGQGRATLEAAGDRVRVTIGVESFWADHVRTAPAAGFALSIPAKIRRRFPGRLTASAERDRLELIVEMSREEAVAATVAAEAPETWPEQALLAQAVVSRSYLSAPRGRRHDYDFCDTTHCQFLTEATERSRHAARQTRGLVLRHRGRIVDALFTRDCGGRTLSSQEVGFGRDGYSYPAVDCPAADGASWTRALPSGRTVAGEGARLRFVRANGWDALPSNSYRIRQTLEGLVAEGRGEGHGVGFCQRGAAALALRRMAFRDILVWYFPSAVVGGVF